MNSVVASDKSCVQSESIRGKKNYCASQMFRPFSKKKKAPCGIHRPRRDSLLFTYHDCEALIVDTIIIDRGLEKM